MQMLLIKLQNIIKELKMESKLFQKNWILSKEAKHRFHALCCRLAVQREQHLEMATQNQPCSSLLPSFMTQVVTAWTPDLRQIALSLLPDSVAKDELRKELD